MKKYFLVAGIALLAVGSGYLVYRWFNPTPVPCDLANYAEATRDALLPDGDVIDPAAGRVTYLEQGWTPADSMEFYTRTQGSRLLPYTWFVALEQAGNERAFIDPAHMNAFRFLLAKKSPCNPDGLPVGFVKDPKRDGGQEDWVGLNCAACHTAEIHYRGTAYRVDGGPAMVDMDQFLRSLARALVETAGAADKFDRFAKKVLPAAATPADRTRLKGQLSRVADFRAQYNARNRPPHADGFARLDAFGRIMNEVLVRHLNLPEADGQARPPDAPVSYPFLWDTPHHDYVQWNAAVANRVIGSSVIGSLSRNVGEVLGVFGEVEVPPAGAQDLLPGYNSSVRVGDLKKLEEVLRKLQSPLWPGDFPAVDPAKRDAGEKVFRTYCASCHAPMPDRTDPNRAVRAVKTPLKQIRTDPRMATNFSTREGNTGPLQGRKRLFLFGERFGERATGDEILVHVVLGAVIKVDNNYTESELLKLRDRSLALTDDSPLNVYKARPLNGIWATAPYLHNGSVPTLWELLKPAKDRVKAFSVGSREFDPVHVGFQSDAGLKSAFVFRTVDEAGRPVPGNGNDGHEYGTGRTVGEGGDGLPALDEKQRWELLEYLKSL